MPLKTVVAAFAVYALFAGGISWAADDLESRTDNIDAQALEEPLARKGWQRLGFDDVPPTDFSLVEESIRIQASASNALIYRPLTEVESNAQFMTWSWRVDSLPPSKPLTKVDDDDRAIALYVIFEIDPRKLSWWGRIRSSVVARFSGLPRGQILTYVWGNQDAIGDWFPNPYIRGTGRVKVLRNSSQALGLWQDERIDMRADFMAAFGYEPIKPIYTALSADTEDSGAQSVSWIRNLRFVADKNGAEDSLEREGARSD